MINKKQYLGPVSRALRVSIKLAEYKALTVQDMESVPAYLKHKILDRIIRNAINKITKDNSE